MDRFYRLYWFLSPLPSMIGGFSASIAWACKRSCTFRSRPRRNSKLSSLPFRFLHRRFALQPSVQYGFLELPPIPQFESRYAVLRIVHSSLRVLRPLAFLAPVDARSKFYRSRVPGLYDGSHELWLGMQENHPLSSPVFNPCCTYLQVLRQPSGTL